jgi:RNA polymerase-binding transcription factor DksA
MRNGASSDNLGRWQPDEPLVAVDELRARLRARRRALLRQVARAEDDLHWLDTNVEIEIEEEGQEAALARVLVRLDTRERSELDAIDRALVRIAAGDYGRCQLCDRLIPVARLEALPEAETCVACAAASEPGARGR